MANLVGKTIQGRYTVQKFLGRGGMAEVYKVWDSERTTYLAMKVLLEDLAIDRVFIRRFTREANTLANLQHPNIVRFYDFEKKDRLAFMLMDYIEGTTLKHLIHDTQGAPMPEGQVRLVMNAVARALHYAHKQNLTHCDIKPANIMIDKSGIVKLADFGIARVSDAATATMVGAGTPAYMAPEQARGEDPTPKSDIYALGVVLYEMMTGGERPFTGEIAQQTGSISEKIRWEQINADPTPPSKWNPDISPEMEEVILKCLEKDPDNRYETTLDLLNAVELALGDAVENAETAQYKMALLINKAIKLNKDTPQDKFRQFVNTMDRKLLWGIGAFLFLLVGLIAFLGSRAFASPAPMPVFTQTIPPTQTELPTYTPYPTLTEIPVTNTPSDTPTPLPPTNTPGPSPTPTVTVPPCTGTGTRISSISDEKTSKGVIVTITCSDGASYQLPPIHEGFYEIGPNKMFMLYIAYDGDVYGNRVGEERWHILPDNIRHFYVIKYRDQFHSDIPKYTLTFHGDHPYSVTIYEGWMNEKATLDIPPRLSYIDE